MKRWALGVVLSVLVAAGIAHEVWWSRRFDDQDVT